jgi:hypothetical protein
MRCPLEGFAGICAYSQVKIVDGLQAPDDVVKGTVALGDYIGLDFDLEAVLLGPQLSKEEWLEVLREPVKNRNTNSEADRIQADLRKLGL